MSWSDDYLDDYDGDYQEDVTCRFCGEEGLSWEREGGRWVLVDDEGEHHNCRRVASVDDFENLDA